jgi:hypothetical protein
VSGDLINDAAVGFDPLTPPLPGVFLLAQRPFYPAVKLLPFTGLESYFLRGHQQLLNLLQA